MENLLIKTYQYYYFSFIFKSQETFFRNVFKAEFCHHRLGEVVAFYWLLYLSLFDVIALFGKVFGKISMDDTIFDQDMLNCPFVS